MITAGMKYDVMSLKYISILWPQSNHVRKSFFLDLMTEHWAAQKQSRHIINIIVFAKNPPFVLLHQSLINANFSTKKKAKKVLWKALQSIKM